MRTTLTIILTILLLAFFGSTALAEKTGYCKTFSAIADNEPNNLALFSVSLNTKFVLQRLYISGKSGYWSLSANNNFSISGRLYNTTFRRYEFPDGSAVFNAEDDLALSYISSNYEIFLTIIGYFEDTVPVKSSADINGDGKVNMLDFAILSKQWLNNA